MEIAAAEILFLSEFWTGVVAVIGGAIVLVILWFLWDEYISALIPDRYQRIEEKERKERERAARGVLICDFVDKHVLATVARQQGVNFQPQRIEHGDTTTQGVNLEAGKGLRGRLGREKKHDHRAYYEIPDDPNALLVDVLQAFQNPETGQTLHRTVELLPPSGLISDEVIEQIVQVAAHTPELQTLREAAGTIREAALREQKLNELRALTGQVHFLLAETEWVVMQADEKKVELQMNTLQPYEYRYMYEPYFEEPSQTETVSLPADLHITVSMETTNLTDQGAKRLTKNAVVAAGVFGTNGAFDETGGRFAITPIAVFARVRGGQVGGHYGPGC